MALLSTRTFPAYCGRNGHIDVEIGQDIYSDGVGAVRFNTPGYARDPFCFHIDDPKAAAVLIECLQPLADKAPKPRRVSTLGDSEKDAVWGQILGNNKVGGSRYMWTPVGWLRKFSGESQWFPWDGNCISNPFHVDRGFEEILT